MARSRREALLHAALDDVFEVDDAERGAVFSDDERCASDACDLFNFFAHADGKARAAALQGSDAMASAAPLRMMRAVKVDAGHARLRGEGNELGVHCAQFAAAEAVLFLGEDDDGATFGSFVGERGELRGVGEPFVADAGCGDELSGLAVAEGDGAGLVEQQGVDVARCFDCAAGHGEHVVLHEAVHAGDADGREQAADGRRDEADQQRDKDEDRLRRLGVDGEGLQRDDGQQEDDGEPGEQDVECDFVGRLLPLARLRRARSCGRGRSRRGSR